LEKKINEKIRKNKKFEKKQGKESLWITVVIHSVLFGWEQKSTNIILKNKKIKKKK